MREQRLSWIEETRRRDKISRAGSPRDENPAADVIGELQKNGGAFEDDQNDDELYSLPQPRTVNTDGSGEARAGSSGALFLPHEDDTSDEDFGAGPNDDELDALMDVETAVGLADASANSAVQEKNMNTSAVAATAIRTDDFEDEMEAMAGFGPPDW